MDLFFPDRVAPSRPKPRAAGRSLAPFGVAALVAGFVALAVLVTGGHTAAFDRAVIMALRENGNPADPIGPAWVEEMARDVTALGSYALLGFLLFAVLGYLMLIRKRGMAALMLASVMGGVMLSNLLKLGFDRPRPDVPHAARVFTASFPSGHAMLSAVTFLTLGAILTRVEAKPRVKAYCLVLAIALTAIVGSTRVYLGLHYPTDVLAGWCVGAAWALLCWMAALRLQRRGQVEQPGVEQPGGAEP